MAKKAGESKIERDCCKLARLAGWGNRKGFSQNGGADRIFYKSGKCFHVEFKRPGGRQQANQKAEEEAVRSQGTQYYVVDNVEVFVDILRDYISRGQ